MSTTSHPAAPRPAIVVAPVLAFALLFTPNAWAYLDPGTGSILLQGLIAGVAAATTILSLYWQKAKAMLRTLFGRARRDDGDDDAPGR